MIEHFNLPIEKVKENVGQIPGLQRNPRIIRNERFEKLKKSIKDLPEMTQARDLLVFPFNDEYVVIGGNMRLKAYQDLGWGKVPCCILPSNMPVDKLREMVIQDNNPFGETDWDAIANEWNVDELKDWGIELPEDWNTSEAEEQKEAKEDDFSDEDAEKAESRVRLGEIWQLGEHRLMCGDSTDAASVALLMDGEKADMVFTDPPYGVSIGDKNKALNSIQPSGRCTENIANDNISVDDLYPILVKAMINCRENSKDCACYYVTSPQGGELALMMMMMKDAGLPVRHMLIWEKNSATFSLGRLDYDYQHEPIFYPWTKSHKNYRNGEFRTTIWKYDKPCKCDLHPTMKPVELVANCMMDASVEGDVIIARWEKLTGKEAVKVYG